MRPEDLHPGLSRDRLSFVAGLIREARHSAVQSYEPEKGDLPWTLGCIAYARSIHTITQAVEDREWLTVVESGLHFVFAVDGVPIRFYRGEPEAPPVRTLRRRYPEVEAQQLAFGFVHRGADDILRLAVDIDEEGEASAVTLVQVEKSGEVIESWRIPFAGGEVRRLYEPKEPVDVGPPRVGVWKHAAGKED